MKMVHHLPLVLLLLLIISRIRAQQQQPPSYVYVFAPHGTGDALLFASITELSRSTAASNNSTGSCILTSNMRYDKETKSLKPSSFPRTVRELKAQCPQGGFLFTRLAKGLDEEKARADQLRAATGGGGGGGGSSQRKCLAVFQVRNPLDVMTSLWHISKKIPGSRTTASSAGGEVAAEAFAKARWANIRGRYEYTFDAAQAFRKAGCGVIMSGYEDMVLRPDAWAASLVRFLGLASDAWWTAQHPSLPRIGSGLTDF